MSEQKRARARGVFDRDNRLERSTGEPGSDDKGVAAECERLNREWPERGPWRIAKLVEMSPAELAEWEAWKSRPVAGTESDTPAAPRAEGMPPDGTWWERRATGKAAWRVRNGKLEGSLPEPAKPDEGAWTLVYEHSNAAEIVRLYLRTRQYIEHSPAPTVKETLTVPPPLEIGQVVDGRKPEELARIPVGAETVYTVEGDEYPVRRESERRFVQTRAVHGYNAGSVWIGNSGTHRIVSLPPGYGEAEGEAAMPEPESGTRWNTGNGFYEWISGEMSWVDLAGCRVTKLTAAGESHWNYADARYGPRIPPTPPATVEAAGAFARKIVEGTCGMVGWEHQQSAVAELITARDAAIRAEERRRFEAELERVSKERDGWKDKAAMWSEKHAAQNNRLAQSGKGGDLDMLNDHINTAMQQSTDTNTSIGALCSALAIVRDRLAAAQEPRP